MLSWLKNIKMSYKLGAVFVLLLIPLFFVIVLLVGSLNKSIHDSEDELEGVKVAQAIYNVIKTTAEHRGAQAGFANGNQNLRSALDNTADKTSKNFSNLLRALNESPALGQQKSGGKSDIYNNVEKLKSTWGKLDSDSARISANEGIQRHNLLIEQLLETASNVAGKSKLSFDPDGDAKYMALLITKTFPKLGNAIGKIRANGTAALATGTLSKDREITLVTLKANAKDLKKTFEYNESKIFDYSDKQGEGLRSRLSGDFDKVKSAIDEAIGLVEDNIIFVDTLSYDSKEFFDRTTQSINIIYKDLDVLTQALMDVLNDRVSELEAERNAEIVSVSIATILAIFLGAFIVRNTVTTLGNAGALCKNISEGKLDNHIDSEGKDEFADLFRAFENMQDVLLERMTEVGRLASAVEFAQVSLMMADNDLNIVSLNPAVRDLLKVRENQLRGVFPGFSVDDLVGKNIDIFHKNPAHQRAILEDESRLPYKSEINVGDIRFRLTAFALKDEDGNRLGTCVQWEDLMSDPDFANFSGQIDAIGKSYAVIEFEMDGTIIEANENFLKTTGYDLEEIQGKHHSIFAPEELKNSAEYSQFWKRLNQGDYESGEYKRITKSGKEIWIQASYNPILDMFGKPFKVVKYATEVTAEKVRNADYSGQIEAVGKSTAVIEFDMKGYIQDANENFLGAMGYSLAEIKGQHHSMFVEPEMRTSPEYTQFWEMLGRGEFQVGEYKRIGKGGKEIWIQASYNPILDLNGNPFKVVKFATDVTARKRSISLLREALLSLSTGDVDKTISEEVDPDFEDLKVAMNSSMEQLKSMVMEIIESASHVSSSAKEIAQGNSDLSQRTEEQASSLEETASSMDEFTSTVKENADNAKSANEVSDQAKDLAQKGGEVVGDAVTAMSEIEASSKKISDIIGVIDEIAFQTNLLALNASVEAARAGEQGRGFAVVASEVRNLAQRSADAAKEIKELIQDSVGKVSDGTRLVGESGEMLTSIVKSVNEVSGIVKDIDNASQEQASGIQQVNEAVNQMDEMTQQNAALVEQAAASAESLDEQAGNLLELMRFFNTGGEGTSRASVRSPVRGGKLVGSNQPSSGAMMADDDDEWEEF
ncbi:methyl-accepting chemotaxis protein [Pleionea sp. CnH1-48]|uniref:methyl-accepting chemotaxis protein n=1 Tax=Pleionea sp. CnH1-48 TaxID=2954494 RepID=UPI00273A6838|nr:methyl-accepting chemotaxis protein [Pleionea sp. CnH1-48]